MAAGDQTGQEMSAFELCAALRVRVPDHVVFREFPEQSVVLNLDRGLYHGLNRSGSMMFALLASGETVGAVAEAVSERYRLPPAQAEADVSRLCATLLERGLLARAQPEQA